MSSGGVSDDSDAELFGDQTQGRAAVAAVDPSADPRREQDDRAEFPTVARGDDEVGVQHAQASEQRPLAAGGSVPDEFLQRDVGRAAPQCPHDGVVFRQTQPFLLLGCAGPCVVKLLVFAEPVHARQEHAHLWRADGPAEHAAELVEQLVQRRDRLQEMAHLAEDALEVQVVGRQDVPRETPEGCAQRVDQDRRHPARQHARPQRRIHPGPLQQPTQRQPGDGVDQARVQRKKPVRQGQPHHGADLQDAARGDAVGEDHVEDDHAQKRRVLHPVAAVDDQLQQRAEQRRAKNRQPAEPDELQLHEVHACHLRPELVADDHVRHRKNRHDQVRVEQAHRRVEHRPGHDDRALPAAGHGRETDGLHVVRTQAEQGEHHRRHDPPPRAPQMAPQPLPMVHDGLPQQRKGRRRQSPPGRTDANPPHHAVRVRIDEGKLDPRHPSRNDDGDQQKTTIHRPARIGHEHHKSQQQVAGDCHHGEGRIFPHRSERVATHSGTRRIHTVASSSVVLPPLMPWALSSEWRSRMRRGRSPT